MEGFSLSDGHRHSPGDDAWAEALVRTVAHLAAQLTVVQLRLRALASETAARGGVDEQAVSTRLADLAVSDGGRYLRENLGEALTDLIDVDALERDLVEYLAG